MIVKPVGMHKAHCYGLNSLCLQFLHTEPDAVTVKLRQDVAVRIYAFICLDDSRIEWFRQLNVKSEYIGTRLIAYEQCVRKTPGSNQRGGRASPLQ